MPEVVIVDEIGTEAEALACRSIAERGVQLVATAHGRILENIIKNPTLCDLVGGIASVTLGASSSWLLACHLTSSACLVPCNCCIKLIRTDETMRGVLLVMNAIHAKTHTTVVGAIVRSLPSSSCLNAFQSSNLLKLARSLQCLLAPFRLCIGSSHQKDLGYKHC